MVGISYRQLDYWARTDLVRPSLTDATGSGSRRLYSYRDLLELRVIKSLLDAGIKLESVRTAFDVPARARRHRHRRGHLVISGSDVLLCDGDQLIDMCARRPGRAQRARHRRREDRPRPAAGAARRGRRRAAAAGRRPSDDRAAATARSTPCTAQLGAKMVPFGGWEMPVAYPAGTIDEHLACRTRRGRCSTCRTSAPCAWRVRDALDALQAAFTNDLNKVGARPRPVHAPARRGRCVGARRHHRVVGAPTTCST